MISSCCLGGSLVTMAWHVLRLRMEGSPLGMEGSCKYIEQAVSDSRQGVVLQLGGWAWGQQPFTVKIFYCYKMFQSGSDLDWFISNVR
jgi:hypothetical protein